ncbi:deleted in azoospermia-like, partial [Piliocolobus tephrosceles]|uniref:deleted in azoospermia-like n=1 Tax=Piliocolobus tephrosceles TaxID=591936 RepID=UPI000E6B36B3
YGFVSFFNDVDVQKIVESQIHFHGKKLKLGPAIRKQKLCARHVQPCRLVFNPPPPPQFRNVCSNPNAENYLQPPITLNPVTQYVQEEKCDFKGALSTLALGKRIITLFTEGAVTSEQSAAANSETSNSTISREANTQSASAAASQGHVLPEGKIMPNTVFVGGIDNR